jgi:hypothetical protein
VTRAQLVSTVGLLVLVGLVGWAMVAGWRGRRRRTGGLVETLPTAPQDLGAARTEPIEAQYVTTTRAGDWLDRVAAADLGVRGNATVQVFDAGVRIDRQGEPEVFLPAAALVGAGTAPGMAGKVVGREGLVVLTWRADPNDERGLDTGLRTRHAADRDLLVAAASALIATTSGSAGREENA